MTSPRRVGDCLEPYCDLPKVAPKHRCVWHLLALEPVGDQVAAAHARRDLIPVPLRRARLDGSAWAPGTRWCAGCQTMIPTWYARGSRCRACASEAAHASMTKRVYGLTATEYAQLLHRQGGRCAVCRNRPVSIRLAVDHDHRDGAVRGLLCSRCNHDALGTLLDSVEVVRNLLHYLEHPPAQDPGWVAPPARGEVA